MSNGVRVACPECTWSCVMHAENETPPGVRRMVEGTPYCPNCDLPMKPIGSVPAAEPGAGPSPGLGEGLSLAERLEKIREAQREVAIAEEVLNEAKRGASEARKAYDGKVVTLCTIIERMTAVPKPVAALPLFDGDDESMANAELACFASNGSGDATLICTRPKGHNGPHIAHNPVGVDAGREITRWAAQADAGMAIEAEDISGLIAPLIEAIEPAAEMPEDEALPLPTRRRHVQNRASGDSLASRDVTA